MEYTVQQLAKQRDQRTLRHYDEIVASRPEHHLDTG